jgi:caffeoyl-CoA O-methyltransferase
MNERSKHLIFEPAVQETLMDYIVRLYAQETDSQREISRSTTANNLPQINLRPEEGSLLYFLASLVKVERAIEIGTLAGYSASWIARALPENGKLISLEADEKHARVARQNMERAGFADKVEIRVGDAHDILPTLEGPFDMAFLDADKTGYPNYLSWALEHMRPGGLIAAHNAFQHGRITLDKSSPEYSENIAAMQAFNQQVADEERLLGNIIPVGDGLLVAMVR